MPEQDTAMVIKKIKSGKIGVIPTDTVYGLVADAMQPVGIERIYTIKNRSADKPFIILINDIRQLRQFNIVLSAAQSVSLTKLWQNPVSVILPCPHNAFHYLHRGYESLAFRLPTTIWLKDLIQLTGPIVATSANVSGQAASQDLNEIKKLLAGLDFYLEGVTNTEPSRLARLDDTGNFVWLQRG